MPVGTVESSPGHRVPVSTCEGCGNPALFGQGVNMRDALRNGDVARAGKWWCGWRDGDPLSDTTGAAEIRNEIAPKVRKQSRR